MQGNRLKASLPNAVVRLFRQVNRVHNRELAPLGVSAEQAHVLSILQVEGPMTMGTLQRHLQLSSATLTGAIDRLEAQDLVRRRPAESDKRAYVLEPCMSARQWTAIENGIVRGESLCFDVLTAAERKELLRLLDKCSAHLEEIAVAK